MTPAGSSRRYRVVDVFTRTPLAGNGLAVVEGVPLDADRSPDVVRMQSVARAFNLSETTFVERTGDHAYDVRIFTPSGELPFAGHPTLGTAATLGEGTWSQRSGPHGDVHTEVEVEIEPASEDGAVGHRARLFHDDPVLTEVYPDEGAAACGLPLSAVPKAFVGEVGGTRHLLLATEQPLQGLRFDALRALAATRAVRATGLGVLRPRSATTIDVRLVVPADGNVFEDPGTGSAAGAVAFIARQMYVTDIDVEIAQGQEIGRPCIIEVHAEPGAVSVAGHVSPFAEGNVRV